MKYLVVTGGVVSGLGKGISISSIGVLLRSCGLKVTAIKIDPYLNSDAGTMSPFEHGEVFVLNDGGERFLHVNLTKDHNITTGKVYHQVILRERRGDYLGKTVQVVPHITNAVQDWIQKVASVSVDGSGDRPDICLVEVGGTVGDIESLVFLEALRQLSIRVGRNNIMFVHVSLVPVLGSVGEQKTKPTQHSVKELRSVGITPDVIICRSGVALEESTKRKIALHCQVSPEQVFGVHDVSNIYHVPLLLEEQHMSKTILERLRMESPHAPDLENWTTLAKRVDVVDTPVNIALVGKYNGLSDSYLSVLKALKHASIACGRKLDVHWVDASHLEPAKEAEEKAAYDAAWDVLKAAQGVLVPGGFGDRGVEGKILAAAYARDNKVPFLGVCLGFQCAAISFCRDVLHWEKANSEEFDADHKKVIVFMPEINPGDMGGTMRLGARPALLTAGTLARTLYGHAAEVQERHRHRYEVDPEHVSAMEAAGLIFSGRDESGERMETLELPREQHPFYFATQYHPEFKSHPHQPSPPFMGLMLAASGQGDKLDQASVANAFTPLE